MTSGFMLSSTCLCHTSTQLSETRYGQSWSVFIILLYSLCTRVMGSRSSHVYVALSLKTSMENGRMFVNRSLWCTCDFIHDASLHQEIRRLCLLHYQRPDPRSFLLLVASVALTQGHSCLNPSVSTRLSAFRPAVPPYWCPESHQAFSHPPTSLIWSNLSWYLPEFCVKLCPI